jgi:hypothetical protein
MGVVRRTPRTAIGIALCIGAAVVAAAVTARPVSARSEATAKSWLFAVDFTASGSRLFKVDPGSSATELIGATGFVNVFDIAMLPDGSLIGVTVPTDVATSRLLRINRRTGAAQVIGSSLGADNVNALEASSDGSLYGATADGQLLSINVETGAGNPIGTFGAGLGSSGDLAFGPDGTLYALVTSTSSGNTALARINRGTGAATVIGSTGLPSVFGLAFGPDGTLYGTAGAEASIVVRLNTQTGAATVQSGLSGIGGIAGLAANIRLSPVVGALRQTGVENAACDTATDLWTFCQHRSGTHAAGAGLQGADDTYAWDANLPANADAGRPVFAVAPGRVVRFAGAIAPQGNSSGAVLIEHSPDGQSCTATPNTCWWSAYQQLRGVQVFEGQLVDGQTLLGVIGDVHPTPVSAQLHVAVYEGLNTPGGLVAVDVTWQPRRAHTTVFRDDAESGAGSWQASGGWAITTSDAYSGSRSWTDSPSGDYISGADARLLSPAISLSGVARPVLRFWHRFDLERTFDFGRVFVTSDNGATFTQVAQFTGTQSWRETSIDLDAWAGQSSIRLLFQLVSDELFVRDGWYLDDITVTNTVAGVPNPPAVVLRPAALNFGATRSGSTLVSQTPAQSVVVSFAGTGTVPWTATSNRPWLQVTGGSGTGSGTFSVAIVNPNNVIGTQPLLTGTILVVANNAANAPLTIPVTLTVTPVGGNTQPPFGAFDTPVTNTSVQGSIAVTGWALDDVGIDRVEIWRDLVTNDPAPPFRENGHPADGKVFIALGTFSDGSRPDVEATYTSTPFRHRAGWGYLLLTWGLPNANGTFVLTAIGWDKEGRSTVLGTKTITVNNATATKPFGSIDVPAYGATFSGNQFTYGWALTPASGCTVSGGQKFMTIDSAPPNFPITYGANRADIAAAFPGFADTNGAGGAVVLNSTNYPNGTHAIGWLVYDSCGNGEGIGSRFFTILNSGSDAALRDAPEAYPSLDAVTVDESTSPLWLVRGIGRPATRLDRGATLWLSQTGRIEIHATDPGLAGSKDPASISEGVTQDSYDAYLAVNGEARPLPLGSSFDRATGSFYWQPVPGFLGEFPIRIVRVRAGTTARVIEAQWTTPVVVSPGVDDALLQVDAVSASGLSERGARVEGWTLDPQATHGSGIGAVHVWATKKGSEHQGAASPVFLGQATLGVARRDVGDRYGSQFNAAGFRLSLPRMDPGTYEIVVYAWSERTAQWAAARLTTVTVR